MFTQSFKKVLIFVPVLLTLACSTLTPKPAPSAVDIEKEEQAVYSFFVGASTGPALILEETSSSIGGDTPQELKEQLRNSFKDISRETVESFAARNVESVQLSPDMDLGVEYVLLSHEELAEISSQPNWGELLTEKYPGSYGYTIFSRVGFNNTLDEAVIYVGNVAGPLMGSGDFYLMEKIDGEWLIKEQYMIWIS